MAQLFKNIFNSSKEKQAAEVESVQNEDSQAQAAEENAPETEKKAKHGEEGVCCGGCS